MDWNLYQRVENQITYSVSAPNVSHYLGQNDDQVQLTCELLANGAAGNLPAGGSWTYEIYKDNAGIINAISDNGVITFNKAEGSAYVKIAFTWSEGTAYKYVKVTAEADPNGCDHVYTAETVEATCTQDGYTVYTCHCGETYTEVISATGHKYEAVVTAPTCEEIGYTTYTCACGHSYTHADADGYRTYTCTRCGHSYSEKLSFTYSQVSALTSGERFVITVKSGNKYYALSHSGNEISAVRVTVSGGKITSEITEDLLWSYDNGKLSYVSGGTTYYLCVTTSSNWWWSSSTLRISSGESDNVSLSNNKLKIDSTYLRYSSSKFSVSSSGSTVYLFREE